MIRGIGPVYAGKMVRAFGEKVFDIIEAEPERLREVTGIGRVRAKRITDAWAEQKVIREIMVLGRFVITMQATALKPGRLGASLTGTQAGKSSKSLLESQENRYFFEPLRNSAQPWRCERISAS